MPSPTQKTSATPEHTQWTIILRAQGDGDEARAALGELVGIYQRTVRLHVVRCRLPLGLDVDDVVQDYFHTIIARGHLRDLDRAKGSFKAWLAASVRHHTWNAIRASKAQRRGRQQTVPGLVTHAALEGAEPAYEWDRQPDERYHAQALNELLRAEALDVCDETLRRMMTRRRKPEQFELLRTLLPGRSLSLESLKVVAAELGLTESVLRDKMNTLRAEFKRVMSDVIAAGLHLPPGQDPLLHPAVRKERDELCAALEYAARPCPLAEAPEKSPPSRL